MAESFEARFWRIEDQYLAPREPKLSSLVCENCGEYVPIGTDVYQSCMGNFCEDCLKGMTAYDFVKEILREDIREADNDE